MVKTRNKFDKSKVNDEEKSETEKKMIQQQRDEDIQVTVLKWKRSQKTRQINIMIEAEESSSGQIMHAWLIEKMAWELIRVTI